MDCTESWYAAASASRGMSLGCDEAAGRRSWAVVNISSGLLRPDGAANTAAWTITNLVCAPACRGLASGRGVCADLEVPLTDTIFFQPFVGTMQTGTTRQVPCTRKAAQTPASAHSFCFRVGNALGANDPWLARCCTCVVLTAVPLIWACGAVVLVLPGTLGVVLATFTHGEVRCGCSSLCFLQLAQNACSSGAAYDAGV